jgi:hypothetical protein
VVAGDAKPASLLHHILHDAETIQNARATIHEIADKDGFAAFGMPKERVSPQRINVGATSTLVA